MDLTPDLVALKKIIPRLHSPERYSERRPWGGFDRFVLNERCTVKILTIMPSEAISLQTHANRSEWWIVLDAKLDVEVNGKRRMLYRGEDVFIPPDTKHRVFGLDKPCRWLEIAFGIDDEADIHRFADKYGRTDSNSP